jgi:hypothetical protein
VTYSVGTPPMVVEIVYSNVPVWIRNAWVFTIPWGLRAERNLAAGEALVETWEPGDGSIQSVG